MKRSIEFMAVATVVLLLGFATTLSAQQGKLIIPRSSHPQPVPAGESFVAHSNIRIYIPAGFKASEEPPYVYYPYETPASIGCVYSLSDTPAASYPGCSPNNTALEDPTGGSRTIAVVDPYDDPSADGDLAWFSLQFGLPELGPSKFQVVWANTAKSSCFSTGVQPDPYGEWEIEEATDIEWAHAMAPSANIYLVEACSNSSKDLQEAVLVANNLVSCGETGISSAGALNTGVCGSTHHGGEVTMSWGGAEFSGETGTSCTYANLDFNDACFTTTNIVYVGAVGDYPGVQWPATSVNVVAAGGLTHRRNPSSTPYFYNLFTTDGVTAWMFTGGGESAYEKLPSYQKSTVAGSSFASVCGTSGRCVPDLSFDADPNSGVWVYDTYPLYFGEYVYQWWVIGGTSVSAASLAGIINNANTLDGAFAASTNAELTKIYTILSEPTTYADDFTDITFAYCGPYMGFTAGTGWDFCSGVGAVFNYYGVM